MASPICGITKERRAELVCKALMQAELFEGLDRKHRALAMGAASLMTRVDVRQLAEVLVTLADQMEVSSEERAAILDEAWRILAGRERVEITGEGQTARIVCEHGAWIASGDNKNDLYCSHCGLSLSAFAGAAHA